MGYWLINKINGTEFTQEQVLSIVTITLVMLLLVLYAWSKE